MAGLAELAFDALVAVFCLLSPSEKMALGGTCRRLQQVMLTTHAWADRPIETVLVTSQSTVERHGPTLAGIKLSRCQPGGCTCASVAFLSHLELNTRALYRCTSVTRDTVCARCVSITTDCYRLHKKAIKRAWLGLIKRARPKCVALTAASRHLMKRLSVEQHFKCVENLHLCLTGRRANLNALEATKRSVEKLKLVFQHERRKQRMRQLLADSCCVLREAVNLSHLYISYSCRSRDRYIGPVMMETLTALPRLTRLVLRLDTGGRHTNNVPLIDNAMAGKIVDNCLGLTQLCLCGCGLIDLTKLGSGTSRLEHLCAHLSEEGSGRINLPLLPVRFPQLKSATVFVCQEWNCAHQPPFAFDWEQFAWEYRRLVSHRLKLCIHIQSLRHLRKIGVWRNFRQIPLRCTTYISTVAIELGHKQGLQAEFRPTKAGSACIGEKDRDGGEDMDIGYCDERP